MQPTIVTVFGSSQCQRGDAEWHTANRLGRAIARRGWTLCNGGYGGTMEAAAQGAVEAGGHTIGVTCRIFRRRSRNPFIRQEVPTFDLLTRLDTLIRLGRAYVVLPGGTGTLLELALVWEQMNKSLPRRRCPVILLGEHWSAVVETVLRTQPDSIRPTAAATVGAAVEAIEAVFRGAVLSKPSPPG